MSGRDCVARPYLGRFVYRVVAGWPVSTISNVTTVLYLVAAHTALLVWQDSEVWFRVHCRAGCACGANALSADISLADLPAPMYRKH